MSSFSKLHGKLELKLQSSCPVIQRVTPINHEDSLWSTMMKCPDLLKPVKCDGDILQLARVSDEGENGVTSGHAPQLLVHFGPMTEKVLHPTFSYDLQKEGGTQLTFSALQKYSDLLSSFRLCHKHLWPNNVNTICYTLIYSKEWWKSCIIFLSLYSFAMLFLIVFQITSY